MTDREDILRILVSGSNEELAAFEAQVTGTLRTGARQRQTVLYTGLPLQRPFALDAAAEVGVTVQEWENGELRIVQQGEHPGWHAGM